MIELAWPIAAIVIVALMCLTALHIEDNKATHIEDLESKFMEAINGVLERNISLAVKVSILEQAQESMNKQAEQVQKLISNSNLAAAFTRK